MPIIINSIFSAPGTAAEEVIEKALSLVGLNVKDTVKAAVFKSSLDARKRNDIHFVHSVYAELADSSQEEALCSRYASVNYAVECKVEPIYGTERPDGRIYVAGFGPAGMFCALLLAENGYRPIVLERGGDVDSRVAAVNKYWQGGKLDTNCNVQFGEGGAGTFSDGKLTTRIKDPLCRYVLERFVSFGAPEDILTKAKPHIGTDRLRSIVKNIRRRIIELGGEIRFNTCLTDIIPAGGRIGALKAGEQTLGCAALVLATGHSARDTFEMLGERNVFLEPKPFSVGVRIEHKQSDVDESLYGSYAGDPLLPKGEYQLSAKSHEGRAVYTFCMCPGGTVVPAASEEGTVVTNGMSEYARDGVNANAAVAVAVSPADFGSSPLGGMYFARDIEKRAFALTDGVRAPAVSVGGFLKGEAKLSDKIVPTYARGVQACSFTSLFPDFITRTLEYGLHDFARKMKCFKNEDALLTGPETRTSSPVRVTRGSRMNSLSFDNLFPCGEGAGYAGGIMSAAVDGLHTALEIMSRFSPE